MVSLSVVIPATDSPPTLGRCWAAIANAEAPPEEIAVVDRPRSLSAAAARNAGVARTGGDVVVFVDSDVVVHPDAFVRIREAFDGDDSLAALFGSYDDAPSATGVVSRFRNLLHHHVHQVGAGPVSTFWTGLGAVRRDAFALAGGFDAHRYPRPSIEDVELGGRMSRQGLNVRLDPAVQGTHMKSWSLASMVWTDFARRGVPWVALQVRDRQPSTDLNCGWRHRFSAACAVALVASVAAGVWLAAAASSGLLLALNGRFYGLLLRRTGIGGAAAGVALHGIHHLVAVVAVVWGLAWSVGAAATSAVGLGRVCARRDRGPIPAESSVGL